MSKQTAVEYLFEKLCGENGYVDTYYMGVVKKIEAIYEEAKAMEREQIEFAHLMGLITNLEIEATEQAKDYYNRTYKGGEQ